MADEPNPYAAPVCDDGMAIPRPESLEEAEQVRQAHLKHEGEILSVGMLCYFACGLWVSLTLVLFLVSSFLSPMRKEPALLFLLSAAYSVVAILLFRLGRGLRRFERMSRWGAVLICALFVLHPLGTIICGYTLYLMLSRKGALVFSPYYAQVRLMTAHFRTRRLTVAMVLGAISMFVQMGLIAVIVLYEMLASESFKNS